MISKTVDTNKVIAFIKWPYLNNRYEWHLEQLLG